MALEDNSTIQVLTCNAAGQEFVVLMDSIDEIIQMMAYREFPNAPPFVVGVINLREELVPIVDLYDRLGQVRPTSMMTDEISPFPTNSRLLIATSGGKRIGGIVNAVGNIRSVNESELQLAVGATAESKSLLGRVWLNESKMVQLLDFKNLLSSNEVSQLERAH